MRIALISCASKKRNEKNKAKNLYTSTFFKYNLRYARKLKPDKIFILSAKHGLLPLDKEIEPYDKFLNNFSEQERKEWAELVLGQLKGNANLHRDEFIFLAGENYRKYLLPKISNYDVPLEGKGIGQQLKFLKEHTKEERKCERLHNLFNGLKRFSFPFNETKIPGNGIYILFEEREKGHQADRIVRVGTHRGENQLRSRLKQHFLDENKDRSIFRKNIGRALLNKRNDPYLKIWNKDFTSRKARDEEGHLIDKEKQKRIEKEISKIIQNNFSFVVLPVENKKERKKIESRVISTISLCGEREPGSNWLGLDSPKKKIRESGLWLVNELYKEPISEEELNEIESMVD